MKNKDQTLWKALYELVMIALEIQAEQTETWEGN